MPLQVNIVSNISANDKFMHSTAYGMLNLCWLLALKKKHATTNKKSVGISITVFFYGIIIEVLQGIVTNIRQADFYDVMANLIGIMLSFIIFSLFLEKKH